MTAASLELSSLTTRTEFDTEGLPNNTEFDPMDKTPEQLGAYLTERVLAQAHTRAELGRAAFYAGNLSHGEVARLDRQVDTARAALQAILDEDPDRIDGSTIVRGIHF